MFKRILAFALCAVMMFSLISCSEEKDLSLVAEQTSRSSNPPITLSLFVPSLTKLSEDTRVAVENALNAISVKKYNTKLKFYAYPEEEYVPIVLSMVESKMNTFVTDKIASLPPEERADSLETAIDYPTTTQTINLADMTNYPELADASIDIFVAFTADADSPLRDPASGEFYNPYVADKFFELMYDQRVLAPIGPRLINEHAILNSKSYKEFFDTVTRPDKDVDITNIQSAKMYSYAMPNNYVIGYYEYLIINKAAVSGIYTQDFDKLSNNEAALKQLKTDLQTLKQSGDANLADITDIYLEFESYEDYVKYTKDVDMDGVENSCAVAKIKGNRALPEVFESEKNVLVNFSSKCSSAEFATSMYCITRAYDFSLAGSNIDEDERVKRCLDILMLIQNDVEFRNTLQYGVKGEHYTVSRDGSVTTSAHDYVMDESMIGNIFLLYPSDLMTESMRKMAENNWRIAKAQNQEMLDKIKNGN